MEEACPNFLLKLHSNMMLIVGLGRAGGSVEDINKVKVLRSNSPSFDLNTWFCKVH